MYTVRVGCFGAFSMIEQRLAQHIANYFCPLSKPEQPSLELKFSNFNEFQKIIFMWMTRQM